jgi:hypothetical protein
MCDSDSYFQNFFVKRKSKHLLNTAKLPVEINRKEKTLIQNSYLLYVIWSKLFRYCKNAKKIILELFTRKSEYAHQDNCD